MTEDSWRRRVERHFTRDLAAACRLTVVIDQDGLLSDAAIANRITELGFEIVPFDDAIAVRLLVEKKYRGDWDQGRCSTSLVLVSNEFSRDELPFEFVSIAESDGRLLTFALGNVFLGLARAPLLELDHGLYAELHDAVVKTRPGQLGEDATSEFILRQVFDIDVGAILDDVDLLLALFRTHNRDSVLPAPVARWFADRLVKSGIWQGWPLAALVKNRADFIRFVEERWPTFVAKQLGVECPIAVTTPGPVNLPFGNKDIRAYVDTMFADGVLTRTDIVTPDMAGDRWIKIGIMDVNGADALHRLRNELSRTSSEVPSDDASHSAWGVFARRWAEVLALWGAAEAERTDADWAAFSSVMAFVDAAFESWMTSRYPGLHNASFVPRPAMVHQIANYLAYRLNASGGPKKIAVVVVDGLSMDQWVLARRSLPQSMIRPDEHAVFAWVPTLTSVSRQSIFAGEPPYRFADTIGTTDAEPRRWLRFWTDKGVPAGQVGYLLQAASMTDADIVEQVSIAVSKPSLSRFGIVLKTVDDMIHGTVRGTSQLQRDVADWAAKGPLWKVIETLIEHKFEIVLTADHGNVETFGVGRTTAGSTAETRGERALIFNDANLRAQIAEKAPGSISWTSKALPDNYLPLLAPRRGTFTTKGALTVAHGGISLEEVVVPFVEFRVAP